MIKRYRVVFFGTPDFSVPSLEILHHHPLVELVQVVSMPDRKAGRGQQLKSPEVAEFAKTHKIPLLQTSNINKETQFIETIKKEKADLFIVLAFAQFLSSELLALPKVGCFNIHTSLLPKYRGAAPIQHAILNGDQETGVSIQKMVKEMDAGDIALTTKVQTYPYETSGMLFQRLKGQAALSLCEFINQLYLEKVSLKKQDTSKVSFAPTLKKEDGKLNFSKVTQEEALNKVRAFSPWPGTFCFLNQKRLKILSAMATEEKLKPGEVASDSGRLEVGCLQGSIRLHEIQLEGKKPCSDIELINGLREKINIE